MAVFHFIVVGLISFLSFRTDSKVDESKTFLIENTAQYGQCIYGIDKENKAWEGDIKSQKNESDNLVKAKVHPILPQALSTAKCNT